VTLNIHVLKKLAHYCFDKWWQPGIYSYDFWCSKIESGTVYLKAYEITQVYALSEETVKSGSELKIQNSTDSLVRFSAPYSFTIYEGDWGKPYAARFEVWFKPGSGQTERKLLSKNFKIEGWMR
jgi:hypothetical protein